jgi:hypothetical protein
MSYPLVNYPMIDVTAVMIHQLAFDLYECLGACWAVVAARTVEKLVPLYVFGESPDLHRSLHSTASMLSCEREGIIELDHVTSENPGSEKWTPKIVCPTFVRREVAGALIFGPKADRRAYPFEQKKLVLEFARHISKLLAKDMRASRL